MARSLKQTTKAILGDDTIRYSSILTFGKYKGRPVTQIVFSDPMYLLWVQHNTRFRLSSKLSRKVEQSLLTLKKNRQQAYESTKRSYILPGGNQTWLTSTEAESASEYWTRSFAVDTGYTYERASRPFAVNGSYDDEDDCPFFAVNR